MRIVEIEQLYNGAHRNQCGEFGEENFPDGWAVVPDDMDTHNFPFGDIEVDESVMPPVVTKWTARDVPAPEAEADEHEPTEIEQLRADVDYIAMETGVDL